MITSFSGEYAFLSNFYPSPIYDAVWRIKFPTAEHLYQSRKTFDLDEKRNIMMCETPGKAKRLGRKISLRKDWEDVKLSVMRAVLIHKFNQNELLLRRLLETGSEIIVEGNNWHDDYWGVCTCDRCRRNFGENHMGILLMDIRKMYLENS